MHLLVIFGESPTLEELQDPEAVEQELVDFPEPVVELFVVLNMFSFVAILQKCWFVFKRCFVFRFVVFYSCFVSVKSIVALL